MLENEFKMLLDNAATIIKTSNVCEVTRLTVSKAARRKRVDGEKIADAIYQGLFIHCFLSGIRHVYMVVSVQVLRALRFSGLPCEAITRPKTMEDGVVAVVALLDWDKFRSLNEVKNPERRNEYIKLLGSVEMETTAFQQKHDAV
jgi:N-acyl-L-homoserine lactone synthetase